MRKTEGPREHPIFLVRVALLLGKFVPLPLLSTVLPSSVAVCVSADVAQVRVGGNCCLRHRWSSGLTFDRLKYVEKLKLDAAALLKWIPLFWAYRIVWRCSPSCRGCWWRCRCRCPRLTAWTSLWWERSSPCTRRRFSTWPHRNSRLTLSSRQGRGYRDDRPPCRGSRDAGLVFESNNWWDLDMPRQCRTVLRLPRLDILSNFWRYELLVGLKGISKIIERLRL